MWTSVQTAAARPRLYIRTLDTQCGRPFSKQTVRHHPSDLNARQCLWTSVQADNRSSSSAASSDSRTSRTFVLRRPAISLAFGLSAALKTTGRTLKSSPTFAHSITSDVSSEQERRQSVCASAQQPTFGLDVPARTLDFLPRRYCSHARQSVCASAQQPTFGLDVQGVECSTIPVDERPSIQPFVLAERPLSQSFGFNARHSIVSERPLSQSFGFNTRHSIISQRPLSQSFGFNARHSIVSERPLSQSFGFNARHSIVSERPLSQSFGFNTRHSIISQRPLSQSFGFNARHSIVSERPLSQSFGFNARHSIRPLGQSFGLNARHSIINERPLSQSFGLNARHSIVNERPLSQSFGFNARHSIVSERPHDRPRMPLGLYRSVIRILTFGLTCSSFLPFGFASFWSIKFNHSVTFNPHMSNDQEHAL
ncbi:hypothetical protein LR48_Vigan10g054000 [Vigna angularis]|uniref:Uncharacterized protein n=1 Tax=Phaseolus angularis TaxID=3914 RepID=A0A0L9VI36_PHAAN|nr:hypothetical protein LR48_Vigan10g054000 [Vigna angularis]